MIHWAFGEAVSLFKSGDIKRKFKFKIELQKIQKVFIVVSSSSRRGRSCAASAPDEKHALLGGKVV